MADHKVTREDLNRLSPTSAMVGMRREVLGGEEVYMPEPGAAHGACVDRVVSVFLRAVGDAGRVSVAAHLDPDGQSDIRPDVAVYGTGDATLPVLVVEVADTSTRLSYDRGRKASFYASSGIRECWVVDMPSEQLLVHSSAASSGYREIRNLPPDSQTAIGPLPDAKVVVRDLFGL